MPISFRCPNCSAVLRAPDCTIGQILACPKCKRNLAIPESTGDSADLPHPVSRVEPRIPVLMWVVIAVGACVPIGLIVAIATHSLNRQSTTQPNGNIVSSRSPAPGSAETDVQTQMPVRVKNPTMGEIHNILVPAGYLVTEYGNNMAWKKGDEAIYFEVSGSGNGQIEREITVLTLFKGGNQIWSSQHIKVDSNKVYILSDDHQWIPLRIEAAVRSELTAHANAAPPSVPSVASSERTMSPQAAYTGIVNHSLVQVLKNSWRDEGWRHKSKLEQARAFALMIQIVKNDITNPADQQATLDYIEQTIDSW